jgi:hypothetical protein
MTWTAYHNRGDVLRAAIATAEVRRDGELPMDVDGVTETFRDELDLLAALALKWQTRLSGQIETAMQFQPTDLEHAVLTAWCDTARELGGVRMILDNYRQHPVDYAMAGAMLKATNKEHRLLAIMAGRAGLGQFATADSDPATLRVGAELEMKAREMHRTIPVITPAEPKRRGFLDRLRDALAA